ncbi:hypothetical protein N2152v2_010707 [Parachlorella kessleri]
MGCASSSLAPDERRSRKKKSEKSLQRLLSANTGAVFRLGPEAQKGVETRLRRLSAPLIPAGSSSQEAEGSATAAERPQHEQPPEQSDPEQPEVAAESVTAAAGETFTAEDQQLPNGTSAAPGDSTAGHAAPAAGSGEPGAAANAAGAAAQPATQPASGRPPLASALSLGASSARRLTVVGTPTAEVAAAPGEEDSSSNAETQESSGDTPLSLSPMLRNHYSDARSRSQLFRQLQDFNLMEHCIHSVASLSRAGREPSYRKTNQDNCFAYQQYLHPSQALFAALDGHGPNGHKVSSFLKKQFPTMLAKQQENEDDNAQALVKTFLAMQQALQDSSVDCEFSGSTAVVCFMHGRQLTTAWVGDSRAVLARQEHRGLRGLMLTRDHKPAAHVEKLRIQAAGGRVERLLDSGGKPIGPHRVWLQQSWVPGLAMSRALGDLVAHSVGVSATPDTDVTNITPQDRFLVLASDGVWEFINSQTAVELIAGCTTAEQACRILVDAAHERWVEEENDVIDDITVVVVKFK